MLLKSTINFFYRTNDRPSVILEKKFYSQFSLKSSCPINWTIFIQKYNFAIIAYRTTSCLDCKHSCVQFNLPLSIIMLERNVTNFTRYQYQNLLKIAGADPEYDFWRGNWKILKIVFFCLYARQFGRNAIFQLFTIFKKRNFPFCPPPHVVAWWPSRIKRCLLNHGTQV